MIRPGDAVLYEDLPWTVEKLELRGFAPNTERWAKLVRYEGTGKKARLIGVRWVLKDELEVATDGVA